MSFVLINSETGNLETIEEYYLNKRASLKEKLKSFRIASKLKYLEIELSEEMKSLEHNYPDIFERVIQGDSFSGATDFFIEENPGLSIKSYIDFLEQEIVFYNKMNEFEEIEAKKKADEKKLELDSKFNVKQIDGVIKKLTRTQAGLFYDFIKKNGYMLDYGTNSFSKIVHYLTGHSEQNIKTDIFSDFDTSIQLFNGKQSTQNLEVVIETFEKLAEEARKLKNSIKF